MNTTFLLADHIASYQAIYRAGNIDRTDVKNSSACPDRERKSILSQKRSFLVFSTQSWTNAIQAIIPT